LRAAALCKYRLETVFGAWLRGARSASVDPTANHQDVQKQCVHAALQFILTVRDRGRLTHSVAQFFRRARPGLLVAPALVSPVPAAQSLTPSVASFFDVAYPGMIVTPALVSTVPAAPSLRNRPLACAQSRELANTPPPLWCSLACTPHVALTPTDARRGVSAGWGG
jgi:hypothetical protein